MDAEKNIRLSIHRKEAPPGMVPVKLQGEMGLAERLFQVSRDSVRRDQRLYSAIEKYRRAIRATGTAMESLGVVGECADCARDNPGSCCFQGVEEWYDSTLLLINLLMGCDVRRHREIPGHCLFVGERGCTLTARHAFCVNYLCPRLKRSLGPERTRVLLASAGHELNCGWQLEKLLLNAGNRHGIILR